jgi:phosphocarrier protein HPr
MCGSYWIANRRRAGGRRGEVDSGTPLAEYALVIEKGLEPMMETLRRSVRIANPNGLHMRPAAAFAELAAQFDSSVKLGRDAQTVDGKNWLELLLLAAEPGTELMLEVSGPDAPKAIEALAQQLASVPAPENDERTLSPKG